MTRPTNLGYQIPLLSQRLGSELPNPITDPQDAVDRALDMQVWVPLTEGDFSLVQSKASTATNATSSITTTFDDPPTQGNLLLAAFTIRSDTTWTDPAGWTKVGQVASASGGNDGATALYYKIAGASESSSLTVGAGADNNKRLAVAEFSGVGELFDSALADAQPSASTYPVGPVTLSGPGLVIGLVMLSAELGVDWTEDADFTNIDVGRMGGGFAPMHTFAYDIAVAGAHTYEPSSDTSDGWAGIAAAFETPDFPWQLGGGGITDGDDDTYETIDGPDVLVIDLEEARHIVTAGLRIACENSGSRTYTLEGANEADFSDAVTLDSVTFTATGSFTAQDVQFSWSDAGAFQYFRLTGNDETRRIHTLELYEATTSTAAAAAVAEHVADTTDAHDASAISYDPTTSGLTATTVQTAIDEIVAAGVGSGPDTPVLHGSMGAAETVDVTDGVWHRGTLDTDCTITVSGFVDDEGLEVRFGVQQDGTGGHGITWDADVVFGDGADDQPGQDANQVTWFVLWSDEGDSVIYGAKVGSEAGGPIVADLDDLTDVAISSPTEGQLVVYRSGSWVNETPASATGHWEVLMTGSGVSLESVTTDDETDWIYAPV